MEIITTEIESVHGDIPQKMVFYRCMDDAGVWHPYGPVIVSTNDFDIDAHKTAVSERVAASLECV